MHTRVQQLRQDGKTNQEILDNLKEQFSSLANNIEEMEAGLYSMPNSGVPYTKNMDWPSNPVVYRCQESSCLWFRSQEAIDYHLQNNNTINDSRNLTV